MSLLSSKQTALDEGAVYVPSPNAVLGAVFQGVFLNILKIFFFALSMLS